MPDGRIGFDSTADANRNILQAVGNSNASNQATEKDKRRDSTLENLRKFMDTKSSVICSLLNTTVTNYYQIPIPEGIFDYIAIKEKYLQAYHNMAAGYSLHYETDVKFITVYICEQYCQEENRMIKSGPLLSTS